MSPLRRTLGVFLGFAVVFMLIAAPASGAEKAKAPEKARKMQAAEGMPSDLPAGALTAGGRAGDGMAEGFGDVLVPVLLLKSGLVFVNPRVTLSDDDAEEYNVGVGYRHLFPRRKFILGANLYYDYRETPYDSEFNQLGLGVEFLSEWVDARANYYLPDDDKETIGEWEETTVSKSSSSWTKWGKPYAAGNNIYQKGTAYTRVTTTKTTYHFEQYEQAMEGWDAEFGIKLPLPVIDKYADVRVFGGYYDFDTAFSGVDVQGFKGRLEVRALPSLTLDVEVFEDDLLTGSDYTLGARVQVPFDVANISEGRNPFEGAGKGFEKTKGEADFVNRLTEMVIRDPRIRTDISEVQEVMEKREVSTTSKTSSKKLSDTIETDITFVDGDNAPESDATQNGTWEHPYDTIPEGIANPRSMVYVLDAGSNYVGNVTVPSLINLHGNGCPIIGNGGKTFGNGVYPIVNGLALGPTFTLNGMTITLRGFDVRHDAVAGALIDPVFGAYDIGRAGIFGNNADDLDVSCNLIDGLNPGNAIWNPILLARRNAPFFLVFMENNRVFNAAPDGIVVDGRNVDNINVFMDGNQAIGNAGNGIRLNLVANQTASAALFDTIANANMKGDGINATLRATQNGSTLFLLDPTVANGNAGDGIDVTMNAASSLALLTEFQANDNGAHGLNLDVRGTNGTAIAVVGLPSLFDAIEPVEASGNGQDGLNVRVTGRNLALGAFFDTRTVMNTNNGINALILSPEGAAFGVVASGEALQPVANIALDVLSLIFGVDLPDIDTGNGWVTANNNGANGIRLRVGAAQPAVAAIFGAQAVGNGTDGIRLEVQSTNSAAIGLVAMTETDINGDDGIDATLDGHSLALGAFVNVGSDANVNGNGLEALVQSPDGTAIGFVGSADPIVGLLEDLIGGEYGGGAGRCQFNFNGQAGMDVDVIGQYGAAGVFLDFRAEHNGTWGADTLIMSPTGSAIQVIASSDLIGELAGLLGLDLGGGMGSVEANMNDAGGIRSTVAGYNLALSALIDVDAENNYGNDGIRQQVQSLDSTAIALLGGIDANGNAGDGIQLQVGADSTAIAALLDFHANGNQANGVRATLGSLNSSGIALFGSLDPIVVLLEELLDIDLGGLGGYGRATANDNGANGILLDTVAQDGAYGIFLDTQANGNRGGWGISSALVTTNGDAFGLVLSSDLVLALPSIIGLDLPDANLGPVEANGNSAGGIRLTEYGARTAVAVVAGVEANRNVNNDGIQVTLANNPSIPDAEAVGVFLRTETCNNGNDGIQFYAVGSDLAIGAFVDVHANNNVQNGIRADITSVDGDAFGVVMSTDALRPILQAVNNTGLLPIDLQIPGPRFGQVQANNNGANGLLVDLNGRRGANGIFLDVQANNNTNWGIRTTMVATNGGALALFASSDDVLTILDVFDNQITNIIPIPVAPEIPGFPHLGPLDANRNGQGGIGAELTSQEDAMVAFLGVQANGNLSGPGVGLNAVSVASDVRALFGDIQANDNSGSGVATHLDGQLSVFAAFAEIGASGNGGRGIMADMVSANGEIDAAFMGIEAHDNDASGIRSDMNCLSGVNALYTDINAFDNGVNGIRTEIDCTTGSVVVAYGIGVSPFLAGIVDVPPELAGFVPDGHVRAGYNDNNGILTRVDAGANAVVLYQSVKANSNDRDGIRADVHAVGGTAMAAFSYTTTDGNGDDGIEAIMTADALGMVAGATFDRSRAIGNFDNGIDVTLSAPLGVALLGAQSCVLRDNVGWGMQVNANAGVYVLDLGTPPLFVSGRNQVFGNGLGAINNIGGGTVMAQQNWWGQSPPNPADFAGLVDFSNWLTGAPAWP